MNDAHLHMVVNHFPIIGIIFGLGILITGMILKNNSVKMVAYVLFIIATVFVAFSMGTGEGAEELVEDMPSIGKQIIHEHEEWAEKLALVLYVIGALSLLSIFFSFVSSEEILSNKFLLYVVFINSSARFSALLFNFFSFFNLISSSRAVFLVKALCP